MINIAICDDMQIFRSCIECSINAYNNENGDNFHILQFESGEDLIEKFNEDKSFFDLFFLDNYMKKLTGIDTALYIRQYNIDCHIVFVSSATEFYSEFLKVKPLSILSKPTSKEQIYSILDEVLKNNNSKEIFKA